MRKSEVVVERAAQIYATLAAFAFFVWGVIYLYLGRVPVTWADYWKIYDFYFDHSWLESALQRHNGHSLFFPSFFCLADLRFFHGDQHPLFLAGLALLFITALLLLIPVWRDETVSLTAKIISSLVVIIGNFWMGRASITASGGFNCICSLVMVGATLAFLLLPTISRQALPATLMVVCAGVVASFSFGTGLAVWPTLLFLAWCLRLPWQPISVLAVAGLVVAVIFAWLLPPWSPPSGLGSPFAFIPPLNVGLDSLCRMMGAPIFYAAFGWCPTRLTTQAAQSSFLALCCGALGLGAGTILIVLATISRRLARSGLERVGIALVTFDLIALAFIVTARVDHFRVLPFEVVAPRYLFWSTLFWTGLLLVAIQRADATRWLRWSVYLVALALPILIWPKHYQDGLHWRNARWRAESAATSLINGVRDEQQTRILFHEPELPGRVAEQLRARRLDMFAEGLQDWIGVSEGSLFRERYRPEGLKGQSRVAALVQCDNGAPAARIIGQASKHGQAIPKTLVIVDPNGVVRGVARSSPTSPFINRVFYLGRFNANGFLGYIRDYNPQLKYLVRSADDRVLSEETIPVQIPITRPVKP
jgi:hypothetical protein